MEINTVMMNDLKNYLSITWTDSELDALLTNLLRQGCNYLDRFLGTTVDYDTDLKARALLFDWVRYTRAGALDEFMAKYAMELTALQLEVGNNERKASS